MTIILGLSLPGTSPAWIFRLDTPSHDWASDLAVDGAGNALAVGLWGGPYGPVVLKLAPDGKELWRVIGNPTGSFSNVAVAPADDVFAAGGRRVYKLDGATGSELWFAENPSEFWRTMAVDASSGDVILGGENFIVARYDGATGALEWTTTLGDGTTFPLEAAEAVALTAAGDVVAVGALSVPSQGTDFMAVRLSGATGAELWRTTIDEAGLNDSAFVAAIDTSGDVLVGGGVAPNPPAVADALAVRLDGATGAELWRYQGTNEGSVRLLVLEAGGDVFIDGDGLTRLNGATGAVEWNEPSVNVSGDAVLTPDGVLTSRLFDGVGQFDVVSRTLLWKSERDWDMGPSVAVDPAGDVLAAGEISAGVYYDSVFEVYKVSDRLTGRKLLVKDKDGDPSRRKVVLVAKDPNVVTAWQERPSDPAVSGAELHVSNPSTGESVVMSLPAANWRTPSEFRHVYSDQAGPCTKAGIDLGKRFKVKCQGAGIPFTLDEPSQGMLDVKLVIPGGMRYCFTFTGPGVVLRDTPATGGRSGIFKAKGAPQPAVCS